MKLHGAKLSYATLRELDLRRFDLAEIDLQHADLNGTDLRGAVLCGANLQGADLSTARLNGPELQGSILHRRVFPGRELFPQGFTFAQANQLFDAWLVQTRDNYNEQTIQAMWIGFAHRICELYHENDPEA